MAFSVCIIILLFVTLFGALIGLRYNYYDDDGDRDVCFVAVTWWPWRLCSNQFICIGTYQGLPGLPSLHCRAYRAQRGGRVPGGQAKYEKCQVGNNNTIIQTKVTKGFCLISSWQN